MSSETTIEMSPVIPRVPAVSPSRNSLHLDIDRANGRTKTRNKNEDDMSSLLMSTETGLHDDNHPTKPLLPAAPTGRPTIISTNGAKLRPLADLLETDSVGQRPPLAGPEIDDLDDTPEVTPGAFPGIDDGLLEPGQDKDRHPDGDEVDSRTDHHGHDDEKPEHDHEKGGDHDHDAEDGKLLVHGLDTVDYFGDLYSPHGIESRFGTADRPISPFDARVIPDVNVYQQKKNLAQGMMDLALLSANANQLRYVIESAAGHPYFWPSLIFISLSIIFQILVGIGLIMNSTYNVKNEDDICKADKINNMTIIGIFLVTIINVFITAFSVAQKSSSTL